MQFIYNPVESDADPKQVAWHNIRMADQHLDLSAVLTSIQGYFASHENATYQDLEKELRERNCNTHLIACNLSSHPGLKCALKRKNGSSSKEELDVDLKWEMIASVRPPPYALRELLQHQKTYEENFEALAFTGVLVVDGNLKETEKKLKTDEHFHVFNDEERQIAVDLGKNKVRIEFVTAEQKMYHLRGKLREHYPDVELSEFAKDRDDDIVAGLICKNQLVCKIVIKYRSNGLPPVLKRLYPM